MRLRFYISNFFLHGIFCYIGTFFAGLIFINVSDSILAQYLIGGLGFIFFFLGTVNIFIHFNARKHKIDIETIEVGTERRIYTRIPSKYTFELVLTLFLLFAIYFGGFGPLRYYMTGNKVHLAWLVFTFFLGLPALVGWIVYVKRIIIAKKKDIAAEKKRLAGIIGFTAGVMAAYPIFIIGIVGLVMEGVQFGSILATLLGGIFVVVTIFAAPEVFAD